MTTGPIGYAPVPLPSRGLLYGDKLPDGQVWIRKLKVTEEAAIQSSTSGLDLINASVGACVKLPEGMHHLDLLITDRLALLVALRVFTFGRSYQFGYTCAACDAKNRAEADLATLNDRKAADGLSEPIEVALPDAGKTVGLRFLRGRDEAQIAKAAKRVALQSNDPTDSSHILRLALQVATIDGEAVDQPKREFFVRDLTMVDSAIIREAIDEREPGVDLVIHPECKACGTVNDMALPFTADFFRPARRVAGGAS